MPSTRGNQQHTVPAENRCNARSVLLCKVTSILSVNFQRHYPVPASLYLVITSILHVYASNVSLCFFIICNVILQNIPKAVLSNLYIYTQR